MSSALVLKSLIEVFPQVDIRILRATAIEHANDADSAVEFILNEVVPSINANTNDSRETECSSSWGLKESIASSSSRPSSVRCENGSVNGELKAPPSHTAELVGNGNGNGNKISCAFRDDGDRLYESIVNSSPKNVSNSARKIGISDTSSQTSVSENGIWDLSVLVANHRAYGNGTCNGNLNKDGESQGINNEINGDENGDHVGSLYFESELVNRSIHSVGVDFLEEFINDAKNNKMNLLSAVELVTNMIREVIPLEEKVKQVKEEVSTAGQDTLSKVEELKEMLKRAREANNMHAGGIFGEQSILATEARELQSRLVNLSDERNRSLEIIDEIREALEARLVAAEEEIAKAQNEKFERESSARDSLKGQEELMNSIVEESKKLQLEADQNSKLRKFLVERGHIVDSLQGEIAVICEDVMRLKEIMDGHLPLTKSTLSPMSSLSSSTTSSLHKSSYSIEREIRTVNSSENNIVIEKEISNKENITDGWELF